MLALCSRRNTYTVVADAFVIGRKNYIWSKVFSAKPLISFREFIMHLYVIGGRRKRDTSYHIDILHVRGQTDTLTGNHACTMRRGLIRVAIKVYINAIVRHGRESMQGIQTTHKDFEKNCSLFFNSLRACLLLLKAI